LPHRTFVLTNVQLESRHTHDVMGGMMTMAASVSGLFYMHQILWVFSGMAIAIATLANILNKVLYYQRMASLNKTAQASKPKSFFQVHATISAVIREFSYYSLPLSFRNTHWAHDDDGCVLPLQTQTEGLSAMGGYRISTRIHRRFPNPTYRPTFRKT
jgi:hypothetical protein